MVDINNHLIELADKLDKEGKTVCANAVDNLIKATSLDKVAQYVGVIGYVLKQNRAMCNCIRRKRAANDGSMQEVILACLKEYQDGQDYHDTKWTGKYAETIVNDPDKFNKAHLSLIAEIGRGEGLQKHINRVRKVSTVLKENDVDDDVINQVLSHIQVLGDMLRKEAAKARPFKVAADPGKKSRWSRFWESPSNPFSSWYKGWKEEDRMRGDDTELDRELDELTDKVMNISTLSDTMKEEVLHLKSQARYIPDPEMSKIISSLNPNDWNQVQFDIDKLQRSMNQFDEFSATRPINDAVRLSQKLGETKETIKASVADIRNLLQSLARRGAIQARREHRQPGQAESIAVELGMLRKVIRALGQNPLDERAHDYALHMISRLNDVLDPLEAGENPQGDKFPVDTDEELDNFGVHKEISDWMKPGMPDEPTTGIESPVSTGVDPQNIDPSRIKSIADNIRTRVGNAPDAANILHLIGLELMGSNLIDRGLWNILVQVTEALKGNTIMPETETEAPAPPTGATATPTTPVSGESEISDSELERTLREFGAASEPMLLKIADAVDEVSPDLAEVIDKYIREHGAIINLPEMPEFGVVLKE